LVVTTSEGTTFGNDAMFTTPAVKPALSAASPVNITAVSATLRSAVTPNGSDTAAYFEYGTSSTLGQSTPPQTVPGTSLARMIQEPLTSLTPDTVYYYRAVATNS